MQKFFSYTVLLISALCCVSVCFSQQAANAIGLNQVGFSAESKKIAVVLDHAAAEVFYIISQKSTDTLYKGKLSNAVRSEYSSTITKTADFSAFKKTGHYYLFVPGAGNSYPFVIGSKVFEGVSKAALKAFYYQRSGMALQEKYAGRWHRASGYPDTAVVVHPSAASTQRPERTVLSSAGGWFDAGDYNKYIVNSGITVATLLSAYEDYPEYYKALKINIPESGNGLPDILNETLYNLNWMRTMQDPNDGGVYTKCTDPGFNGMIMPEKAQGPRYLVQKSTGAALDFAAVMAHASRVFRPFEKQLPGYSENCFAAAKNAWLWAEKHPAVLYDQRALNAAFDPDITTGEYGDSDLRDEWLWAATELLLTTKDRQYLTVFSQRINDAVSIPSWSDVGMLGYYSILNNQDTQILSKAVIEKVRFSVVSTAEGLLKNKHAAFGTVMGQSKRDFIWGSNSIAANQGVLLLKVYKITGDKKYLEGALSNLDYLLGRNATGYCFVTGTGAKSPMHPHQRISRSDTVLEPLPGFLVGGPNQGMQDKCFYPFTQPETTYVDSTDSYASNEIAINWNAPLVYLVNAIDYHY